MNIQNPGAAQDNNIYMGDDSPFDMSMGIDPHEIHSYETDMSIVQSPLQKPGPSGPPRHISSQLVFQPVPDEPGTDSQDSGEDECEGEYTNNSVTFEPDIERGTLVAEQEYQIKNSLLHTVEESRKLDQMRRIDDLGYFIYD